MHYKFIMLSPKQILAQEALNEGGFSIAGGYLSKSDANAVDSSPQKCIPSVLSNSTDDPSMQNDLNSQVYFLLLHLTLILY